MLTLRDVFETAFAAADANDALFVFGCLVQLVTTVAFTAFLLRLPFVGAFREGGP